MDYRYLGLEPRTGPERALNKLLFANMMQEMMAAAGDLELDEEEWPAWCECWMQERFKDPRVLNG